MIISQMKELENDESQFIYFFKKLISFLRYLHCKFWSVNSGSMIYYIHIYWYIGNLGPMSKFRPNSL